MPEQTVPLNLMIKRLEEANARAHDKIARPDEQVCVLEEEVVRHFSDQQMHPAVALRRSSRGGLALGLIASLMATSLGVLALVWQSPYSDTAKRIVAQWASSLVHSIPQEFAAPADLASSGLEQRLQTMARDLASVALGVKQLKNSLEAVTMRQSPSSLRRRFHNLLTTLRQPPSSLGRRCHRSLATLR